MINVTKDIEKDANMGVSQFLNDFATRHIRDDQVEVLGLDNDQARYFNENMFDFADDVQEEMVPLDEPIKTTAEAINIATKINNDANDVKTQVEKAVEKTKTEMEDKFAAEKQKLQTLHQQELDEQKNKIVADIAANMQADLSKNFEELHSKISTDVAEILALFIGDKIREDTLKNFGQKITKAALATRKPWVLEGNAVLLDALAKTSGFNATQFEMQPTESSDIRLRLNDVVIATRLEPLLAELKELVR